MAAALPVASKTTSYSVPSGCSRTGTPKRATNSRRAAFCSSTRTSAPANMANCNVARPIGPAPTIERGFAGRQRATRDGVGTNAERLDKRQLIERESFGAVQQVERQAHDLAHAAIGVHAEALQGLAAVIAPARHARQFPQRT